MDMAVVGPSVQAFGFTSGYFEANISKRHIVLFEDLFVSDP